MTWWEAHWADVDLDARYLSDEDEYWPYQHEKTDRPKPDNVRIYFDCISCRHQVGVNIAMVVRGDGMARCPCGRSILFLSTPEEEIYARDLWTACRERQAKAFLALYPSVSFYNGEWSQLAVKP